MRTKIFLVVAVVLLAVVGKFMLGKGRNSPPVTVTMRISVAPDEKLDYVAGTANSAKFKYLMGKQSGVKPVYAQKLLVQPVPQTKLLEAQVSVSSKQEGDRYAAAFVDSLQYLCGNDARITLASQSVR